MHADSSDTVLALEEALSRLSPGSDGEAPLCYALARELEIRGEDERSFSYLRRGADSQSARMAYDVRADIAMMERIAAHFDHDYASGTEAAPERRGPIFVLGLPRSGTTLVDRILSTHSKVESLGEIDDFEMTLTRLCWSFDKNELFRNSLRVDLDELGRKYISSIISYGVSAEYLINKTLTNYLYVGLIAKALPGASIIHVRRHPIDACLAIYRTLFHSGCPYSYKLEDLAGYYVAYVRLMDHWSSVFPGLTLEVSYEDLVCDPGRVAQEMVDHCGLEWEPQCLEFDSNSSPVATASAAQVRQPIYRDAVARWKRFETQLEPLITQLREAGVKLGSE